MNEQYGFDAGVIESVKTEFDTVSGNLNAAVNNIIEVKDRTSNVWDSNAIGTYQLEMGNFAQDANSLSICVQKFREWVEVVEQLYSGADTKSEEMWTGYGR